VPRILVVDDEPLILRVFLRLLAPYDVLLASSGEDALSICLEKSVDVLVVDLRLATGGMTGLALAVALRELQPGLAVVVMSGGDVDEPVARLGGPCWGLTKPFSRDELIGVLEAATKLNAS
jgi:DNA-binding NtrC family response regulator